MGMYVSAIMIKVFPLRELAAVWWMTACTPSEGRVKRVHCGVSKRDKEHVAQKWRFSSLVTVWWRHLIRPLCACMYVQCGPCGEYHPTRSVLAHKHWFFFYSFHLCIAFSQSQRPKWFVIKQINFLGNTQSEDEEVDLMQFANCPQVII